MSYTSRYFAALSETIMSNKGTVDKFIGDAVMAIWNGWRRMSIMSSTAARPFWPARQANQELNLAFEREGWPPYRTRFGLHTGNVVVGNVGSADRMNYTVLGASVNLAARLEALNKTYGTAALVSEPIKVRAEPILFRSVDRISPKGFAEKFPVSSFGAAARRPGKSERAFCNAWEEIYTTLSAVDYDDHFSCWRRSGILSRRWRRPYHAESIRQKLNERSWVTE